MSEEKITRMKVVFGADAKQFRKGTDEAKAATKEFKAETESAFSGFADAIGLNLGIVGDGISKTQNVLKGLSAGFKGSAAGATGFSAALKLLKIALISTGIGAIVVALGSLASYFTKTERGADKLAEIMGMLKAVVKVLVDRFSALGETIFKAFSNPKEAIKNLWDFIKENLVNRVEGIIGVFQALGSGMKAIFDRDLDGLKNSAIEAGKSLGQAVTGVDAAQFDKMKKGIAGVTKEMMDEAKAAKELEQRRDALEDAEIAFIKTEANLQKQIAKLRLEEKDQSKSAEERLAANRKANDLVISLEKQRLGLQSRRVGVMQTEINMGEAMASDYRALAEAEAELFRIETNSLELQKSLMKGYSSLTDEINKEAEAIRKLANEKVGGNLEPISRNVEINFDPDNAKKAAAELEKTIKESPAFNNAAEEWGAKFGMEKLGARLAENLKTGLTEAKTVLLDFADTFNEAFQDLAVNFGTYIGELINGTKGFSDFGSIILGTLADLAINVGKIAISSGIAISGIKKALTSMNPYLAIAAGAALVALGTAVKGKLSAVASGGSGGGTFSGNSYVYNNLSASDMQQNQLYKTRQAQLVEINITGEFKQKGSDMYATINEYKRRSTYKR